MIPGPKGHTVYARIKNGKEVNRSVGVIDKSEILELVK